MKCTKTKPYVEEPIEGILLIAEKAKELGGLLEISGDLLDFLKEVIEKIKSNKQNREFFKDERNMGLIKLVWTIEHTLGKPMKNDEAIEPTVANSINNLLSEIKCLLDTECITFDVDDPMDLIDYSKDNHMQIFKAMMSQLRVSLINIKHPQRYAEKRGFACIAEVIEVLKTRTALDHNESESIESISKLLDEVCKTNYTADKRVQRYNEISELARELYSNSQQDVVQQHAGKIIQICNIYGKRPTPIKSESDVRPRT